MNYERNEVSFPGGTFQDAMLAIYGPHGKTAGFIVRLEEPDRLDAHGRRQASVMRLVEVEAADEDGLSPEDESQEDFSQGVTPRLP